MHLYTDFFKPHFLELAERQRQDLHYSQESMAELLQITLRSYSSFKNGQQSLSAPSLLFLLLSLEDEQVLQFLQHMRTAVTEADVPKPKKKTSNKTTKKQKK